MNIFSRCAIAIAALIPFCTTASDSYNDTEAGDVEIYTFSITNTSYTYTNSAGRKMLRPVSIEYSAGGITNSFYVRHVRTSAYDQFGTNSFLQPTNTVTTSVTNYWLLNDQERSRVGNTIVTTNDSSVTLEVIGEPYIAGSDIITIGHTPVATTDVTRTTIIFKEE